MQSDLFGHVVRVWLLAILDVAGKILKCPGELTVKVPALPPGGFGNRPQIVVRLERDRRRDGFGQVVDHVAVVLGHRVDQRCSPRRHVHTALALKVWVKLTAGHAVLAGIDAFTAGWAASRRASAQREGAKGADRLHEMIPVEGAGSLDPVQDLVRRGVDTLGFAVEQGAKPGRKPLSFVPVVDVLVQSRAELVGPAGIADCGDGLQHDETRGMLAVLDQSENPALAGIVLRDERPDLHGVTRGFHEIASLGQSGTQQTPSKRQPLQLSLKMYGSALGFAGDPGASTDPLARSSLPQTVG